MELVRKEVTDEDVKGAITYILSYFRSIERVRILNNVELSVTTCDRSSLKMLFQLLGGRIQHRKLNARWYLRPSCPAYDLLLRDLELHGWTGRKRTYKTKMERAEGENFNRLLEILEEPRK